VSVQSALLEESAKKDVVINLPENKRDTADIEDLCQQAKVTVKPTAIARLGKPNPDRTRPLKVSFPSAFDARTFQSRIDTYKESSTDEALTKLRCRPCRTREEQAKFSALSKEVKKLNEAANEGESFSIRQNGEVWKFIKDNDHWKRAMNWNFSPASSSSGNAEGIPSN